MAEYTVQQLKDAARAAYADGNEAAAKRLVNAAREQEAQEQARLETPAGMAEDVAKATGSGAIKGAAESAGMLSRFGRFLSEEAPFMLPRFLQEQGVQLPPALSGDFSADLTPARTAANVPTIPQMASQATNGFSEYQPQTRIGKIAGKASEFAGGAAVMPMGPMRAALLPAAIGGAGSEMAGQLAQQIAPEYESAARIAGAIGAPIAATAATPLLRRLAMGPDATIPSKVSGENLTRSAEYLRSKGIDVETAQATGSPKLANILGIKEPSLQQSKQLTRAVAREFGETRPVLLTDDVLRENRGRIGKMFDDVEASVKVRTNEDDAMLALEALDVARSKMPKTVGLTEGLENFVDKFTSAAGAGETLSNQYLRQARSQLDDYIKTYEADGKIADMELAEDLIDIINQMVRRNITEQAPDMLPVLDAANKQYRAFLTAERAVNRAGERAGQGYITPNALASAVKVREGVSKVRGTGTELAKLANAAQAVLTPQPSVLAGGGRFNLGPLTKPVEAVTNIGPRIAAATQGQTLEQPLDEVMRQRLLRGVAPRLSGLLQMQQGER